MDREQVIALAKDTGFPTAWISDSGVLTWFDLEHFATLVAAHEREECAKVVDAEQARVLGKQEGESWDPVNINIRMTAVLLPDIAAAIRSRT